MTRWALFARAIRYQKTASDSAFSVLSAVQHGSEEMFKESLKYCTWMPENGKKSCLSYADGCIQVTERLRSLINDGFDQVEKSFLDEQSQTPKKAGPDVKLAETSPPPSRPAQAASAPAAAKKPEAAPAAPEPELKAKPQRKAKKSTTTAAKPRTARSTTAKTSRSTRTARKAPAKTAGPAKKPTSPKAAAAKPTGAKTKSGGVKPKAKASKPKTAVPDSNANTRNPAS